MRVTFANLPLGQQTGYDAQLARWLNDVRQSLQVMLTRATDVTDRFVSPSAGIVEYQVQQEFRIGDSRANGGAGSTGFPVLIGDGSTSVTGTNTNFLRFGRLQNGTPAIDSFRAGVGPVPLALSIFGVERLTVGTDGGIEVNRGATGNRASYIDFVGDDTYTDYGLRVIRNGTGPNATSFIDHRGTGSLQIRAEDGGDIIFRADPTDRMALRASGLVQFPTLGTTAAAANAFLDVGSSNSLLRSTSSRRYKTDIRDLPPTNVLSLQPVVYKSTAQADDPALDWYGLIAEEVAAVDPRLCHYAEIDGERVPDGVQYDRLAVLLLAEVKRLSARVAALEAKE